MPKRIKNKQAFKDNTQKNFIKNQQQVGIFVYKYSISRINFLFKTRLLIISILFYYMTPVTNLLKSNQSFKRIEAVFVC